MKNMEKIKILNTPDSFHPFLVVEKSAGIPSAPLFDGDFSALSLAEKEFPGIKNVRGKKEVEHGLIHRIDTETSGLVLIALSQGFYDFMMKEQAEDRFEKFYRAEVDFSPDILEKLGGFPENPFIIEEIDSAVKNQKALEVGSFFRKFGKGGKEVRPVLENGGKAARKKSSGKLYQTQIKFLDRTRAEARLTQGFRHQVRCHLAWLGFPVSGDEIYNPKYRQPFPDGASPFPAGDDKSAVFSQQCRKNHKMRFEAVKIKFMNPSTGKTEVFEI